MDNQGSKRFGKGIKYSIINVSYGIYGCAECSVRGLKSPPAED
jgi:hypothetical protein